MLRNLALVLRSKVALVIVGTLLVAALSATAVLAATGAKARLSLAAQTPSPAHQCASDDQGSGHTSSQNADRGETNDQDGNQNDVQGTITSVDAANSSFVLTQCNGTTKTVDVSAKTEFGESVRGFADLKTGLFVDVEGNLESNGTLTASSVHVENNASGDDHDASSGENNGGSHTGTPVTGSDD